MKRRSMLRSILSGLMALAVLAGLPGAVPASAADGKQTLYEFRTAATEEGREAMAQQFRTNLITESGALDKIVMQTYCKAYTENGVVTISSCGWYNSLSPERHSDGAQHSGLPYELLPLNFKKVTENLKIELAGVSYPIRTDGMEALNIEMDYLVSSAAYTENSLVFERELQVFVSLDGKTYLPGSVGIRSTELLGGGIAGGGANTVLYTVQTENLLDIPGVKGSQIRGIMLMPNGDDTRPFGMVRINGLRLNSYATKADFDRLVPAEKIETVDVDPAILRQIVIEEGERVARTEWSPDSIIHTSAAAGSSLAATSTVQMTYYPQYKYSGPVYQRNIDSTRELFQSGIVNGKHMNGCASDNVYGMDCQCFVWNAVSRVSRNFAWACMITPGAAKVSMVSADWLKTRPHVAFTDQDVINVNTKQDMFRHYSEIRPGDIVLCYVANANNSVHTRIAKDSHVERAADGTIDGAKSYMNFTEQKATPIFEFRLADGTTVSKQLANDAEVQAFMADNPGCEVLVGHSTQWNSTYTFDELYNTYYVGFTLDEYKTGKVEVQRPRFVIAPQAADKPFWDSGAFITVDSNYRIVGFEAKLEDLDQGVTLFDDDVIETYNTMVFKTYQSDALNAKLAGLPNGHYRLSVSVRSGPFTALGQSTVPVTTRTEDFTITGRKDASGVTLSAPAAAGAGQGITVQVQAASACDAADVEIKFDESKLTFTDAVRADGQTVKQDGGILRVIRVGSMGKAIAALHFTAKQDVTLSEALLLKSAFTATSAQANTDDMTRAAAGNEPDPSLAMKDVMPGAWYRRAVDYALANNVMSGYSANTFGPDNTLTRAMVVQVLYNKENKPASSAANPFKDIASGQWYFNAVRWGADQGVVAGYGGGVFKPDDNVTIEQVAVILHNYAGKPASGGDASAFTGHSDWAEAALKWAAETNLFKDMPFDSVTGPATRAQTAQMLMNYLENK